MLRLKNLLLPVDYSARCLSAADAVRVLATRSAVEVHVLHITDERAQRRADEGVISAFSERMAGFDVRFCELPGDPAQRIIDYSRRHGTDLIVMPARREGPLSRLLRGSVTSKVLRGVACPVWTGTVTDQSFAKGRQITTVACGVDLEPQSVGVLQWAAAFAGRFDARLTVIHASAQLVPVTGVVHDPEWRVRVAEVLRTQMDELLMNAGVEAEIRLAAGEPATAVALAAKRADADVLVIGRRPKGFAWRLRRNAAGMIGQSPCAVISIGPTSACHEEVGGTGLRNTMTEDLDRDVVAAGVAGHEDTAWPN